MATGDRVGNERKHGWTPPSPTKFDQSCFDRRGVLPILVAHPPRDRQQHRASISHGDADYGRSVLHLEMMSKMMTMVSAPPKGIVGVGQCTVVMLRPVAPCGATAREAVLSPLRQIFTSLTAQGQIRDRSNGLGSSGGGWHLDIVILAESQAVPFSCLRSHTHTF